MRDWDFLKIIEGGVKVFLVKMGGRVVHIGGVVYRRGGILFKRNALYSASLPFRMFIFQLLLILETVTISD